MKSEILHKIVLGDKPSFVGTIDYRHLDPKVNTYSWNLIATLFQCGNGDLVEMTVDRYFEKFNNGNDIVKSSNKSTHWDFKIDGKEVELRRFGFRKQFKSTHLFLGYGNTAKRDVFPWSHKAECLKNGDGGYLGVLCRHPHFHLFWFPAKLVLEKHRNGEKFRCKSMSSIQINDYWGLNIFDV